MTETKTRNFAVDLIKAWAILGVLVIHIDSVVLTQSSVGSSTWISGLFWGTLFRASVPLFLMASGAIMLDSGKPLPLKKLFFHNIARIIVAMLFWGFCYKMYHLSGTDSVNLYTIWYSLKRILLFDQEFHFYYIHMILIVYLFLPITRFFSEKADKKLLMYSLAVWLLLAVIYPTFKQFWPLTLLSGLTGQWAINLTYASVGYGLLGYYLKRYALSPGKGALCFCFGFVITFAMTFYLSYRDGILNEMFFQGISPGVFLLAVGIFSLASFSNIKGAFQKIIVYISKASFCIYLSHMFILYILQKVGVTAQILPAVISVPLLSVLVLSVCIGLYSLISKIPILNKWII